MDKRKQEIDEFIIFLEGNQFDSKNISDYMIIFRVKIILKRILGFTLIILAIGIIILPLPHALEIATIYYFNYNYAITVSDFIALTIFFIGIYLILKDKIYYSNIID